MGENSAIEWTDATTVVSEMWKPRLAKAPWIRS